ncbi:hypothetical protein [Conexibacter sp. SYSU D00693]|uniref:hypothetical protein n=1 Tax=Conexibacter sp. SYSU D00693 TaxID=2812560 RepID=UPI00196B2600|nr:hypothetical protein [Conexibacter sp. SYSU D00693]
MGLFDLFRAMRDVETVRLELHFVKPAEEAAREVVEDARLHWWDRDDGTVDVSGDGAHAVALRALEAAKATVPAERERVAELEERLQRILLPRLAALEAQEPPEPWVHPDQRTR